MKFLCIAVLLCLGSLQANANFFDSFSNAMKGIGQAFQQTGSAIANAAKQSLQQMGSTILSQGSSIVGGALASLIKGNLGKGRRDLSAQTVLAGGNAFVQSLADEFQHITSHGVDEIKQISEEVANRPLKEIQTAIQHSIASHHAVLDALQNMIPSKFEEQIGALMPHHSKERRALSDVLSSIGNSLAQAFQPIKESGKQILSNVGTAAQNMASTFAGTLHDNLSQLGSKLTGHANAITGHANEIVHHGTNAVNAIKDSLTDIMSQTLQNMKPHLSGMANELTGAAGDTVNQLTGGSSS